MTVYKCMCAYTKTYELPESYVWESKNMSYIDIHAGIPIVLAYSCRDCLLSIRVKFAELEFEMQAIYFPVQSVDSALKALIGLYVFA